MKNVKYFMKNTNKEIKLGDPIKIRLFPDEFPKFGISSVVDESILKYLVDIDQVYTKEDLVPEIDQYAISKNVKKKMKDFEMDPFKYLQNLMNRSNTKYCKFFNEEIYDFTPELAKEFAESMYFIYPKALYDMLLKEVAIELDKQYKDHIKDSKELYGLSAIQNYNIHPVIKSAIYNYNNIALFRNMSDAVVAKQILKKLQEYLNEQYK